MYKRQLRNGSFSVYGEDYEIRVARGLYFFAWGDGTIQSLAAFDGRTITWVTSNPDYPHIWWDRRAPARIARAARAVEPAVELHDAMAAEEEAGRCVVS